MELRPPRHDIECHAAAALEADRKGADQIMLRSFRSQVFNGLGFDVPKTFLNFSTAALDPLEATLMYRRSAALDPAANIIFHVI